MSEISTLAVLGAGGTMGKGMARNLAQAGTHVRAWNRTFEKLDDLASEENLRRCESASEAISGADAIITMLSDADAVIGAIEDAAPHASQGALWLQTSTIGIEGTERCRDLAGQNDLVFVDAPVLGTKQPAEEGELVILASGPDQARAELEPILEAIGKRTMWVGEAGAGLGFSTAVAPSVL